MQAELAEARAANEAIRAREREQATLLSISEDIAAARNAVALLQVIREKAQQLIPFYDTGVLIVEPDGEHHYDLAVNLAGWDDSEGNQNLRERGLHWLKHPGSYVDFVMKRLEEVNHPLIEDYELRYREFDYPFFPIIEEIGYQEALVAPLKSGGRTFGTLWLNSLEKNHFSPKQFEMFQALADQVAVAVSNILANEEILEREREKALLLSLSEDMATIRDRDDLWRVMMDKLRPLIEFDDAVVICFAPDRKASKTLLTLSEEKRRAQPWYQYIINQWTPTTEPLADVYGLGTAYWSTDAMLAKWQGFAGFEFMRGEGLRHTYQIALKHAGSELGLLLFHFKDKESIKAARFSLYKSIADQTALAVANILANEEILEREREKATLLSISSDVATIRDRQDLFAVINGKVKSIFGFDEMGVYVMDADRQHYRLLYDDYPADAATAQAVRQMARGLPMQGSRIAAIVFADRPAFILTREEMTATAPEAGGDFVAVTGIENVICAPLKVGGQVIGCFNITTRQKHFFTPEKLPLYQSVADQIAVAVANIRANEEIQQLAEERRQRAEELGKANEALRRSIAGLASIDSLDDFLAEMLLAALDVTGARNGAVVLARDDFAEHIVLIEDGQRIARAQQEREGTYRVPILPELLAYIERTHESGEVWAPLPDEISHTPGFIEYHRARGNQAVRNVPLCVNGEVVGWLGLGFAEAEPAVGRQLDLLRVLAEQMTVAVELSRLAKQAQGTAVLEERNRLAREIHDTLAQGFTGVVVQLNAADRIFAAAPQEAQAHVRRAIDLAREGLQEARRSVRALRPSALEDGDLTTALRQMLETVTAGTPLQTEFQTSGAPHVLDANAGADLLRLGQEAVINVLRHADAGKLQVELAWLDNACVRLRVRDDGRGFDVNAANHGFGMLGMRERAARLNGTLQILSNPASGTEIIFETCPT